MFSMSVPNTHSSVCSSPLQSIAIPFPKRCTLKTSAMLRSPRGVGFFFFSSSSIIFMYNINAHNIL